MTRSGFETRIKTTNKGPYIQVRALNAQGEIIGISKVVKVK
jgi:hypothetical protein